MFLYWSPLKGNRFVIRAELLIKCLCSKILTWPRQGLKGQSNIGSMQRLLAIWISQQLPFYSGLMVTINKATLKPFPVRLQQPLVLVGDVLKNSNTSVKGFSPPPQQMLEVWKIECLGNIVTAKSLYYSDNRPQTTIICSLIKIVSLQFTSIHT